MFGFIGFQFIPRVPQTNYGSDEVHDLTPMVFLSFLDSIFRYIGATPESLENEREKKLSPFLFAATGAAVDQWPLRLFSPFNPNFEFDFDATACRHATLFCSRPAVEPPDNDSCFGIVPIRFSGSINCRRPSLCWGPLPAREIPCKDVTVGGILPQSDGLY